MIFIDLSQSWHGKPPRIDQYLVPRCRVQVRHPSDKRAKKFLVCTGSWADRSESTRRGRPRCSSRLVSYERNTIIGPLGTGAPRGDLSGCVRPRRSALLWCNDGRGRPVSPPIPGPFPVSIRQGIAHVRS